MLDPKPTYYPPHPLIVVPFILWGPAWLAAASGFGYIALLLWSGFAHSREVKHWKDRHD